MNLDELRAVQDRERETDSLQHLRDSFYEEVGSYVSDLRAERERRADDADDPFAHPEVRRLTEEIETATEVAESIYERRMGKLVKTASLAAAGYAAETEGLTTEEAALFDELVERIRANQADVLDVVSGGERDGSDGRGSVSDEPVSGGPDRGGADSGADPARTGPNADRREGEPSPDSTPADAPSSGDPPEGSPGDGSIGDDPATDATAGSDPGVVDPGSTDSSPDGGDRPAAEAAAVTAEEPDAGGFDAAAVMGDDDRVTLRITEDVGEIVGVDGTAYDLAVDDVVTLPEENALPLVEKDAATRLD